MNQKENCGGQFFENNKKCLDRSAVHCDRSQKQKEGNQCNTRHFLEAFEDETLELEQRINHAREQRKDSPPKSNSDKIEKQGRKEEESSYSGEDGAKRVLFDKSNNYRLESKSYEKNRHNIMEEEKQEECFSIKRQASRSILPLASSSLSSKRTVNPFFSRRDQRSTTATTSNEDIETNLHTKLQSSSTVQYRLTECEKSPQFDFLFQQKQKEGSKSRHFPCVQRAEGSTCEGAPKPIELAFCDIGDDDINKLEISARKIEKPNSCRTFDIEEEHTARKRNANIASSAPIDVKLPPPSSSLQNFFTFVLKPFATLFSPIGGSDTQCYSKSVEAPPRKRISEKCKNSKKNVEILNQEDSRMNLRTYKSPSGIKRCNAHKILIQKKSKVCSFWWDKRQSGPSIFKISPPKRADFFTTAENDACKSSLNIPESIPENDEHFLGSSFTSTSAMFPKKEKCRTVKRFNSSKTLEIRRHKSVQLDSEESQMAEEKDYYFDIPRHSNISRFNTIASCSTADSFSYDCDSFYINDLPVVDYSEKFTKKQELTRERLRTLYSIPLYPSADFGGNNFGTYDGNSARENFVDTHRTSVSSHSTKQINQHRTDECFTAATKYKQQKEEEIDYSSGVDSWTDFSSTGWWGFCPCLARRTNFPKAKPPWDEQIYKKNPNWQNRSDGEQSVSWQFICECAKIREK